MNLSSFSTLIEVNNMPLSNSSNRRVVMNSRPTGKPTLDNFRIETGTVPVPNTGQILLRTLFLSLDPYMRGRMSDAPSYAASLAIEDVILGGTISIIETSLNPDFKQGDLVLSANGWQEYALSDGKNIIKLNRDSEGNYAHSSLNLGVLGMPGFTAYMGLLDIGQPKSGETVVVAAASGAVGAVVGQIAKIKGCYVIGIAGGTEKCLYVKEELGFDECIDHHAADFAEQLSKAAHANKAHQGFDIYFESVGGAVFEAVLPLLNAKARIPVCGLISQYNDSNPAKSNAASASLMRMILTKRFKIQGFIIFDDYGDKYSEFTHQMSTWINEGKIKFKEDIVEGLENAPQAFIGLLEGKNFGKLIVKIDLLNTQ